MMFVAVNVALIEQWGKRARDRKAVVQVLFIVVLSSS